MFALKREILAFYLNKLLILSMITGLFSLVSCQSLIQTPTVISKISQKHNGSKIYLQGKVIKQAPFLDSGAYQLQDDSGSIWIVTNKPLPPVGKNLLLEGKIQFQTVEIAQQELGEIYIVELKQIEKTNSSKGSSLGSGIYQPQPKDSWQKS